MINSDIRQVTQFLAQLNVSISMLLPPTINKYIYALGYHSMPLAIIDLVGDNRELKV